MAQHTSQEDAGYSLNEIEQYAAAAFDRIRHFDGIEWDGPDPYDREGEYAPGGWIAAVDQPYEVVLEGVYPAPVDGADAFSDRMAAEDLSDDGEQLVAQVDDLLSKTLTQYEPDELALTWWEAEDIDPDLEDPEFYRQVYRTCKEDGAILVDVYGRIAPYTVQLPQMGGEGEGGTRHNAAKGTAHADTYTRTGDPVEFRNIVLSETSERNGEMTIYREPADHRGGKDTFKRGAEIEVPAAWTEQPEETTVEPDAASTR